jgi:uncharacterized cupredoxin-like copper-binding protein
MRRSLVASVLTLALSLAACGGDSATGAAVAIKASDDACDVAKAELPAGKTTFRIENTGNKITEVYVYGPGDKIVTERENIGTGNSVNLTVDLAAGSYEVACKPGQTGNGIRTHLHVSGHGGHAATTKYDREVEFKAKDFAFEGLENFSAKKGEAIEFTMTNDGPADHEFEVFKPDGDVLGEIGPTKAGAAGDVILAFAEAGTYRYVCGITGHEALGMKGTFAVT